MYLTIPMRIKVNIIIIFLALFLYQPLNAQTDTLLNNEVMQSDSLKIIDSRLTPQMFVHQTTFQPSLNLTYSLENSLIPDRIDYVIGLELGRSILKNNYSNSFGRYLRPFTVSEYNYAIERYRIDGDIPFRRTGWSTFRRFLE